MFEAFHTRLHVLIEELSVYIQNEELYGTKAILKELKKIFPNLENNDLFKIIEIFKLQNQKIKNKVLSAEFVTTVPSQIELIKSRKTIGVLREYIYAAENTVLITGYSVTHFAKDLIELLTRKSSEGVMIKFFIDKLVDENIFNTLAKDSSNFKIYKLIDSILYSNLHAKIAIFDRKHAFISSSNLSYNGIINNIEIGSLLHGDKVNEIEELFEEMIQKGFFEEIN